MKGSSASNLCDTLNHVRCVCVEERQAEMERTNENDLSQGSWGGSVFYFHLVGLDVYSSRQAW